MNKIVHIKKAELIDGELYVNDKRFVGDIKKMIHRIRLNSEANEIRLGRSM